MSRGRESAASRRGNKTLAWFINDGILDNRGKSSGTAVRQWTFLQMGYLDVVRFYLLRKPLLPPTHCKFVYSSAAARAQPHQQVRGAVSHVSSCETRHSSLSARCLLRYHFPLLSQHFQRVLFRCFQRCTQTAQNRAVLTCSRCCGSVA